MGAFGGWLKAKDTLNFYLQSGGMRGWGGLFVWGGLDAFMNDFLLSATEVYKHQAEDRMNNLSALRRSMS